MNRRDLIFSDLRTEDSVSVVLDRRADDFRAINSITLCEQSLLILKAVGNFSLFLHYLTAALFLRKLGASFGRP